jgi:hypothetical protein
MCEVLCEGVPRHARWAAIAMLMRSLGYEPTAPSRFARRIDREVCSTSECEHCGHKRLSYRPWWNRKLRSYRAWGVCQACGHVTEF